MGARVVYSVHLNLFAGQSCATIPSYLKDVRLRCAWLRWSLGEGVSARECRMHSSKRGG
jgi:hypothetical protein